MTPASPALALEMREMSKSFPGVRALHEVTFTARAGEVHALIGENGAGKSTLMKILAGAQSADAGEIRLHGQTVHLRSPLDAQRHGVAIIYQEFNLVPDLNVAENIFLGREPTFALGLIDRKRLYADAQALIDRLGVPIEVRAPVRQLSVAHQQIVEIAKALSQRARVLVMDEPTATLTDHEIEHLFEVIRGFRSEGVCIVYISHRLEEVFTLTDRVTVLRDGELVGVEDTASLDRSKLIALMVGRELADTHFEVPVTSEAAPPLLEVRGLRRQGGSGGLDLTLRKGELLALTGLVGAGRTELARAIFGADPIAAGEVRLDGKPVTIKSPQQAVRLGLGLVPEDRKQLGLVLSMVVRENATLANLDGISRLGFLQRRKERELTKQLARDLAIRTPSIEQLVRNLSGGNQQKVVLAKWLFCDSKVLIFDEPTRGIDVGAKAEIHKLMLDLVARGVGVIMISSELPEVLALASRILVMHEGRIVKELARAEATQELIMHYATGGD